MHTGYVLLSNEPKGRRKLMCSEEDLPVMHDCLLCGHSLYLKVKAATASRIACVRYPSVLVHSLRRISSVPKHQPGRVMTSLLFKRSVKIAEHCSEGMKASLLRLPLRPSGHMWVHPECFKPSSSLRAPHSF